MLDSALLLLAKVVLPSEVLDNFNIVDIKSTATEIRIHLDELMNKELQSYIHFESKGFI